MSIYKEGDSMPALEAIAVAAEQVATAAVEVGGKVAEVTVEEAKEIATKSIEVAEKTKDVVIEKLGDIKSMSPEQLREQMEKNLSETNTNSSAEADESTKVKEGLTDEQKQRIKEETGWSDEIIDAIGSWQEYEIYKNAGLVEAEIGGKKCLIRNDIDWNQLDEKGKTNAQRVKEGKAPLDKNGEQIQLHHIGQRADSPLAELTFDEHRRGGNDSILHDKTKETEVHGAGKENAWKAERESYWKARAEYNNEGSA